MSFIKEVILSVANNLNINISEIPKNEFNLLKKKLEDKFLNKQSDPSFLWEKLQDTFTFKDPDAWKLLDKVLSTDNSVIMFFDKENEETVFKFDSIKDIISVLANSFGFVFYLTDRSVNYVLCFNDHNYLIGVGSAKENLKKLVEINIK